MDFEELRRRLAAPAPRELPAGARREAAVALILARSQGGADLLLVERASRAGDPWSGHMAFPGGRREPGDADLLETARRETLEESGIDLGAVEPLGALDDLMPKNPRLPPIALRPFVFGLPRRPRVRRNAELSGHYWLGLDALRGCAARGSVLVDGKARAVRCYRLGEKLVWGMTERMLRGLLGRIG